MRDIIRSRAEMTPMLRIELTRFCKNRIPWIIWVVIFALGIHDLSERAAVDNSLHLTSKQHLRIVLGKQINALAFFECTHKFYALTHCCIGDTFAENVNVTLKALNSKRNVMAEVIRQNDSVHRMLDKLVEALVRNNGFINSF